MGFTEELADIGDPICDPAWREERWDV